MPRVHLFEIEDQPWCPRVLRDAATAYLRHIVGVTGHGRLLAPKIAEALRASGETRIVDLCSGGAGPVPHVLDALAEDGIEARATLTDKYPNESAFEQVARESRGTIGYETDPVDPTEKLPNRPGLLTLFNAFHHFRPEAARSVLAAAARERRAIGVFELVGRQPFILLGVLLTPVTMLFVMPFVRPLRPSWLFFTYVIPLLPLLGLWDGIVSCLRVYSSKELRRMTEEIGAEGYLWDIGTIRLGLAPASAVYLLGRPERPGRSGGVNVVELRGVTKRFGEHCAVESIDLDVPPGGCFGLLGPNGAGKTTTLRMIYGVTKPSAGRVHVFGIDIADDPRAVRERLGVTLQENVLVEVLSPIENLRIFGRYYLLREPELSHRIEELVDFLELRSHANVPVKLLSGGFQRRLAIAMSLVNRPELLILDEPTTGLDPAVRHALWSRVRELRKQGSTVLLTTHYMDEAERLCDRVAIMSRGRVICRGRPRDLIEEHVAREAVELDCGADEEERLLEGFSPMPQRIRSGSRIMLYADDATPVVDWIHRHDGGDRRPLVVRPANLEDVFLETTGADLEGGA